MTKIKQRLTHNNVAHANKIMHLPLIGETQLDEDASFETDHAEVIDMLLNRTSDWTTDAEKEVGKGKKDKKAKKVVEEETEEEEEVEEELEEETEEETEEEEEEDETDLSSLDLPELIDIAKQAKYPKSEYEKSMKNKTLMIKYLEKKAKA